MRQTTAQCQLGNEPLTDFTLTHTANMATETSDQAHKTNDRPEEMTAAREEMPVNSLSLSLTPFSVKSHGARPRNGRAYATAASSFVCMMRASAS